MFRKFPSRWLWHFTALMLLSIFAAEVFARAGGGEGFGGGGGGGGGGDGEAIGILIELLIRLCIYHPKIGIPLTTLVIIGFLTFSYYTKRAAQTAHERRFIRKNAVRTDRSKIMEGVATLRETDPAFDDIALNARVKAAFLLIQKAWSEQNLAAIRPFVSDGVYERFSLQIDEQQQLGYRNRMDDVQILGSRLVEVLCHPQYQEATFSIRANAHDHRVDRTTGHILPGHNYNSDFVEYWTFIRRAGVKTQPGKPGLMEGHCPNCGAAIELNQHANCRSCGAMLRSGEFDWVLSEITQSGEWSPAPESPGLPGLEAMLQRDPLFNRQQLEDFVSVLFWRKVMAERRGSVDPIRAMVTDEYAEQMLEDLRPRAQGYRTYNAQCAVGSVRALGVMSSDAFDIALVRVRWSGILTRIDDRGRSLEEGDKRIVDTVFVLHRKAGAVTRIERLVSSAHCRSCGAPESNPGSKYCEYCGAALHDVSVDWVLASTGSVVAPPIARLLEECRAQSRATAVGVLDPLSNFESPSQQAALVWVIRMVLVDHVISTRERSMLVRLASRLRINPHQLDLLMDTVRHGTIELPQPSNRHEARAWMEQIVDAALLDGGISPDEKKILSLLGKGQELVPYDVEQIIRQRRRILYQHAKNRD